MKLADRVYTLIKSVPPGHITTYRAIGEALGTKAYRAIGQALRNNPNSFLDCHDPSLQVPCHRVVASSGKIGGFMGKTTGEEIDKKIKLLRSEGITFSNGKVVNFKTVLHNYTNK